MQSKRIIGIILVVALALSAASFIFSQEIMRGTNENDTVREHDETDRIDEIERYIDTMRNDSVFLNSIGGSFTYVSGIFNRTGDSTAYIYASGGQPYSVIIDTPNGTVKSAEKVDRFPEWVYQIKTEVRPIQKERFTPNFWRIPSEVKQ